MSPSPLQRLAAAVDARALDLTQPLRWALQVELAREAGLKPANMKDLLGALRRSRGIRVSARTVRSRPRADLTPPEPEPEPLTVAERAGLREWGAEMSRGRRR